MPTVTEGNDSLKRWIVFLTMISFLIVLAGCTDPEQPKAEHTLFVMKPIWP